MFLLPALGGRYRLIALLVLSVLAAAPSAANAESPSSLTIDGALSSLSLTNEGSNDIGFTDIQIASGDLSWRGRDSDECSGTTLSSFSSCVLRLDGSSGTLDITFDDQSTASILVDSTTPTNSQSTGDGSGSPMTTNSSYSQATADNDTADGTNGATSSDTASSYSTGSSSIGMAARGTSSCGTVWAERVKRSFIGRVLYRYRLNVYFCWNGSAVSNVSSYTQVRDVDGWQDFKGNIESHENYYNWANHGTNSGHYSFRQGHFQNCVIKYGCISNSYPWVKIWVHRDGSWLYDTGD